MVKWKSDAFRFVSLPQPSKVEVAALIARQIYGFKLPMKYISRFKTAKLVVGNPFSFKTTIQKSLRLYPIYTYIIIFSIFFLCLKVIFFIKTVTFKS